MNRQRKILIGLVVALILALASTWFRMPTQQRVSQTASSGAGKVVATQATSADSAQRLHIELLERPVQRFRPPERDLFNFVVPPPKISKTPVVVAPPPPPPPPTPEMVRRTEVTRALARFTFLGYLLKDQRRTVFLSQGESLFLVQEGDRFGDNDMFHAVSITPQKMMIAQADNPGVIEIQLVEKAPLVPTFDARDTLPSGATVRTPGAVVSAPSLPNPPPAFNSGSRQSFNSPPKSSGAAP